jgi:hypothetical protein
LWIDTTEDDEPAGNRQQPAKSRYFEELLNCLSRRGVVADSHLTSYLQQRIELIGKAELRKLAPLGLPERDFAKMVRRLGWGFAITEFIAAPAFSANSNRGQICSLGALVNVMVVTCDRLLDAGMNIESVLPSQELASGGGSSCVMLLLREYFEQLATLCPDEKLLRTIRRTIALMFEAEIQTVRMRGKLPYLFWLRKCSLPFVLMGLSAWAGRASGSRNKFVRYVLWVYRLGKFFGILDDAIDYHEDLRTGQPNYLRDYNESQRSLVISRAASRGAAVLEGWDNLMAGAQSSIPRETFLHTVWGW